MMQSRTMAQTARVVQIQIQMHLEIPMVLFMAIQPSFLRIAVSVVQGHCSNWVVIFVEPGGCLMEMSAA